MKTQGNVIFITGGSTGIGLAIAKAFLHLQNTVIICGRDEQKLELAQKPFQVFTRSNVILPTLMIAYQDFRR